MTAGRPALHLPWHRGTTAHNCSLYPFAVQGSFGHRGAYVGLDVLAGGAEFCWDPFEAYACGQATNPNCWILGEPGNGKSALVKTLLWRMAAIWGSGRRGRFIAIADPKGEYVPLADHLGLNVVRLTPGGSTRLNPLAESPRNDEPAEKRTLRRAELVAALVATVLDRPLEQTEDAAVFAAVEALTGPVSRTHTPDLTDVAALLANPSTDLLTQIRCGPADAPDRLSAVLHAMDKLLSRSLRGMFDGPSTIAIDWNGPGLVLDLSAVPIDSEALPLVMVAATGWLTELMTGPGPQRVQVLDEAWALLANRHTASYLQTCFKLGRTYGIANICIAHRPSDLGSQADDGTAIAKIATGLLADSATKILLRQAPDQLDAAQHAFGLTEPERQIAGRLDRGRALWKIGGRTAVVQHTLAGPTEEALVDTDTRMSGLPPPEVDPGQRAELAVVA